MEEGAKILTRRCDEAFDLYRRDCSHAVWHVVRAYKHDQPYMQANDLVAHVSRSTEWAEVPISDVSGLANKGVLVVGGLQEEGHGHVIVVYPGPEKPKGGFYFINKETGEKQFSAPSGMYARAMSTSFAKAPFPGAISRGDKTVRDPWPKKKFSQVRFWRYLGSPVANSQKENAKRFRNSAEELWI